ncbi:hypothetical protein O6H91_17G057400 [Diphasiastrum complanatum]|uniref:Uncharacterized protein n=1 Tax=Diphasiastrum complanatum TaxID=34168 RepID=A0ACC2B891_DIPCM|nr:hypothetical protein O6H91_17G057400 [Diphasiastrum complanatum]
MGMQAKAKEMELNCDFCSKASATVYCRADAARLCLSCDHQVHSANSLSQRHFRTLLCQRCGTQSADVHCSSSDDAWLCQACDYEAHGSSSAAACGQKCRPIDGFSGSPTAAELASMWGCGNLWASTSANGSGDYMEAEQGSADTTHTHVWPASGGENSAEKMIILCSPTPAGGLPSHIHLGKNAQQKQIVLKQLMQLHMLQPHEMEQLQMSFQNQQHHDTHLQSETIKCQTQNAQLEVPLSENVLLLEAHPSHLNNSLDSPIQGDFFWSNGSPTNQLWGTQMQELGLCDTSGGSFEGFSIADVDLTLENYDDIFSASQNVPTPPFEDYGVGCIALGQNMLETLKKGHMESISETKASNVFEISTEATQEVECGG